MGSKFKTTAVYFNDTQTNKSRAWLAFEKNFMALFLKIKTLYSFCVLRYLEVKRCTIKKKLN